MIRLLLAWCLILALHSVASAVTLADGNGSLYNYGSSSEITTGSPYWINGVQYFYVANNSSMNYATPYYTNSYFFGGTAPGGLYNYFLYTTIRYEFDLTQKNQEILRSFYLIPIKSSVDDLAIKQSSRFTNMSAALSRIETKIGTSGGDTMTYEAAFLGGLIMALIVAVVWKG